MTIIAKRKQKNKGEAADMDSKYTSFPPSIMYQMQVGWKVGLAINQFLLLITIFLRITEWYTPQFAALDINLFFVYLFYTFKLKPAILNGRIKVYPRERYNDYYEILVALTSVAIYSAVFRVLMIVSFTVINSISIRMADAPFIFMESASIYLYYFRHLKIALYTAAYFTLLFYSMFFIKGRRKAQQYSAVPDKGRGVPKNNVEEKHSLTAGASRGSSYSSTVIRRSPSDTYRGEGKPGTARASDRHNGEIPRLSIEDILSGREDAYEYEEVDLSYLLDGFQEDTEEEFSLTVGSDRYEEVDLSYLMDNSDIKKPGKAKKAANRLNVSSKKGVKRRGRDI